VDTAIPALMDAAEKGDTVAAATLFATFYAELRRIARRELARQGISDSLSPTTVLHEAYLDMAERTSGFPDRARFMGYAARVMRGLIIDSVREQRALKRGSGVHITSLATEVVEKVTDPHELPRLGDALDMLARVEPSLAEIVDLKFFCGFSFAEIVAMQAVSERTVQRKWEKARLFLHRTLRTRIGL
jgi:RNA polymerase sigma factor (TIGR02999 family)